MGKVLSEHCYIAIDGLLCALFGIIYICYNGSNGLIGWSVKFHAWAVLGDNRVGFRLSMTDWVVTSNEKKECLGRV